MEKKKFSKLYIILVSLVLLVLTYDYTPLLKVPLGNLMFGRELCSLKTIDKNPETNGIITLVPYDEHFRAAGCRITPWKCKLCFRINENSDTAVPKLCLTCAIVTNRCADCGDLLDI